ncbi:MAG: preprotein translocase subunit SecG [Bacteroidales bacterium]|nr:preprotein translocase subunit SecG [Bacteroidales bacterium]
MHTLFVILILVVCILLSLIVLVQNSKGGGLASNFSSSNQYMGVRKTTDFLEKATWTLATALLAFSLLATVTLPKADIDERSRVEGQFDASLLDQPTGNTISLPESTEESGNTE